MATKAFLHIDGVDYELPFEITSPHDQALQSVKAQIANLTGSHAHAQTFQVLLGGRPGNIDVAANGPRVIGLFYDV